MLPGRPRSNTEGDISSPDNNNNNQNNNTTVVSSGGGGGGGTANTSASAGSFTYSPMQDTRSLSALGGTFSTHDTPEHAPQQPPPSQHAEVQEFPLLDGSHHTGFPFGLSASLSRPASFSNFFNGNSLSRPSSLHSMSHLLPTNTFPSYGGRPGGPPAFPAFQFGGQQGLPFLSHAPLPQPGPMMGASHFLDPNHPMQMPPSYYHGGHPGDLSSSDVSPLHSGVGNLRGSAMHNGGSTTKRRKGPTTRDVDDEDDDDDDDDDIPSSKKKRPKNSNGSAAATSGNGVVANAKKPTKSKKKASKNYDSDADDDGGGGDGTHNKQSRSKAPSSNYRGVSKCSKDGRWQARIRVNKQVQYLGRFKTELEAAIRYDAAAREFHGEAAILNFPRGSEGVVGHPMPATRSDSLVEAEETASQLIALSGGASRTPSQPASPSPASSSNSPQTAPVITVESQKPTHV